MRKEHLCCLERGVDRGLTWSSPRASRLLKGWRVVEETDTLSDHLDIEYEISATTSPARRMRERSRPSRWSIKDLDENRLLAALQVGVWSKRSSENSSLGEEVEWLRRSITDACDTSMPRVKPNRRKAAYWWLSEIADLRRNTVRTRRLYTRARRRGDQTEVEERYQEYREARKSLRNAVRDAMSKAWEELLLTLDEDPWGRPYKIVLDKLRPWPPPKTESMDPQLLETVVSTLFPSDEGSEPYLSPLPLVTTWGKNGR